MAEDLEDVYEAIREDKAWDHLRKPGVVLVPGEGASRPNILICGEAPGATENTARHPFQGASGKVLRSLIVSCAGLHLQNDVFITNVLKYWPGPGNRTPTPYETVRSVPYLRREWTALGCPRVLVAVGGIAKNAFAPHLPGVLDTAGKGYPLSGGRMIWPMVHPAYILRKHGEDRKLWEEKVEAHWEALGDWYRREVADVR